MLVQFGNETDAVPFHPSTCLVTGLVLLETLVPCPPGRAQIVGVAAFDVELRPLIAHCHLGLGKLYRRTGMREQAQEHLITATTLYREMGMTYWLEKSESEMAGLG